MQWKDWNLLPFECISCNVYLRSTSFSGAARCSRIWTAFVLHY